MKVNNTACHNKQEDVDIYIELKNTLSSVIPYVEKENFLNDIPTIAEKLISLSTFDECNASASEIFKNNEVMINCFDVFGKYIQQLSEKRPCETYKKTLRLACFYREILDSLCKLYNTARITHPELLKELQQQFKSSVFYALKAY